MGPCSISQLCVRHVAVRFVFLTEGHFMVSLIDHSPKNAASTYRSQDIALFGYFNSHTKVEIRS
jgi:hypothetical protein